ncbi:hypothetical protein EVG20_g8726 [Dentipellis fragilis]|uniref:Uncharacterized protein n=1 Tax=Dentipellis fragilis TaxID=205917 RepID=A0A4Y9Y816_9AGAM|nr:hypothetical protein EVG20_g8726 [Dentipellis fragilis]
MTRLSRTAEPRARRLELAIASRGVFKAFFWTRPSIPRANPTTVDASLHLGSTDNGQHGFNERCSGLYFGRTAAFEATFVIVRFSGIMDEIRLRRWHLMPDVAGITHDFGEFYVNILSVVAGYWLRNTWSVYKGKPPGVYPAIPSMESTYTAKGLRTSAIASVWHAIKFNIHRVFGTPYNIRRRDDPTSVPDVEPFYGRRSTWDPMRRWPSTFSVDTFGFRWPR